MPKLNTTTSGIITSVFTADGSPTLELQQNGVTIRTLGESQLVSGVAQSTATGATAYDFTGIPSWAKRVTVMFSDVSASGTSNWLVQLGDSGGIETTDYDSTVIAVAASSSGTSFTAGFGVLASPTAANAYYGQVIISLLNAATNTWSYTGTLTSGSTTLHVSGGGKSLSATLDRVRITTVNGTDTFDAGTVNVMWE